MIADEGRPASAEERVRRALEGDALTMVFQPIFDLRDGQVVGVEALARFRLEPLRSPDRWFAEAAAVELLVPLEMKAVQKALAAIPSLPDGAFLSLNASPETVASDAFLDAVADVEAKRVVVEVRERDAADGDARFAVAVDSLHDLGAGLALDDAYDADALTAVRPLNPEFVKLDIQLCRNIDLDRRRFDAARALLEMLVDADTIPIGEGIQSRAEAVTLRELGVVHGQGYFMALPGGLPLPDLSDVALRL